MCEPLQHIISTRSGAPLLINQKSPTRLWDLRREDAQEIQEKFWSERRRGRWRCLRRILFLHFLLLLLIIIIIIIIIQSNGSRGYCFDKSQRQIAPKNRWYHVYGRDSQIWQSTMQKMWTNDCSQDNSCWIAKRHKIWSFYEGILSILVAIKHAIKNFRYPFHTVLWFFVDCGWMIYSPCSLCFLYLLSYSGNIWSALFSPRHWSMPPLWMDMLSCQKNIKNCSWRVWRRHWTKWMKTIFL